MKQWFTPAEIEALRLPGVPATLRSIRRSASGQNWREARSSTGQPLARKREGAGKTWEYHYTLFPSEAVQELVKRHHTAEAKACLNGEAGPRDREGSEAWDWFERQPERRKAEARRRKEALDTVKALWKSGVPKNVAVAEVAAGLGTTGRTVYRWEEMVVRAEECDWLPLLAPRNGGGPTPKTCDPRAWEFLKADYLRPEAPTFESCWDRLQLAAQKHDWDLPSSRTMRRRIKREIPEEIRVLAREGRDALRRLYPHQERDRRSFHALEAVNADGHKWDVFVRWPDGTIGRPVMVAIQDLYSNKILAWRVDKTENADAVRLAFSDVFRRFGIPRLAWLDNGRGFASKWITGGTANRYRFKVKAEEPQGLLTACGVEVHWTKPYSGQSKPIERAFKDLCEAVAKHPAFTGAYTGNKPDAKPENYGSKAVDIADFLRVAEQGIRLHNAKAKRNTDVCARRLSFDQAFAESFETSTIKKPSAAQLRMCLLAAEQVRADRVSGALKLLGNRYWSEVLAGFRGKTLTVRFDPDELHGGVHVYQHDGVYVGFAECLERAGFADTQAAREHNRKRAAYQRNTRERLALEKSLSIEELADLLPEIEEAEPPVSAATGLFIGSAALKPELEEEELEEVAEDHFLQNLGTALTMIEGGRDL